MATAIWSFVVVSVAVAAALALLIPAQRLVPFSVREAHNSHTAAMFGALYVVYGLMVGFSAYLVAFQFDAAQQTVANEANSVEEIYRLAEQLPDPERREVQGLAESYARTVVEEGWLLMEQGRSSSRADKIAEQLRRSVMSFKPETEAEQAIYAQSLMLALFTIRALEYPFDGIVQVGPDTFEAFLDQIQAGGRGG